MSTSQLAEILYDNASEPGFRRLRASWRRRLAVYVAVTVAGFAVVTAFFGPPAISSRDPLLLAAWLSLASVFVLMLGWGLFEEREALHARVTTEGIERARGRLLPRHQLREASVEDSSHYVLVRERAGENGKPLLGVLRDRLANPEKFKWAVEELIRRARESAKGSMGGR